MQIYILDETKGADHMRLYIDPEWNTMEFTDRDATETLAQDLSETHEKAQVRFGDGVLAEFEHGKRIF